MQCGNRGEGEVKVAAIGARCHRKRAKPSKQPSTRVGVGRAARWSGPGGWMSWCRRTAQWRRSGKDGAVQWSGGGGGWMRVELTARVGCAYGAAARVACGTGAVAHAGWGGGANAWLGCGGGASHHGQVRKR
jgi:hypothetical protein